MNIARTANKVNAEKWSRYKYNLTTGIGENGKRLTGCKEHIALSRKIAGEGMVLLENNGSIEAINLDFVIRIREYPRDKKGKKKSVVLD